MKRNTYNRKSGLRAQVALEYALGVLTVLALSSLLVIFYQPFVQFNLYGGAEDQNSTFSNNSENKALGLHRAAALPFP